MYELLPRDVLTGKLYQMQRVSWVRAFKMQKKKRVQALLYSQNLHSDWEDEEDDEE